MMITPARLIRVWLLSTSLLCAFAVPAYSTLIDNFSDGNDAGWSPRESLTTGGPGVFDASSGRYVLSSTSSVTTNRDGTAAFWQDSALSSNFSDGILTARVLMDNDSSNISLVMRADESGWTNYSFSMNNNLDAILITLTVDEIDSTLAFSVLTITSGTEYWLEAQAIGSDLSLSFWEVGEAKPLTPLLSVSDSALTSGQIGLAAYHWGGDAVLSSSFDDVTFVPEPNTAFLLTLGLIGIATKRRRLN
jgi:hypothetical protein